MTMIVYLHCPLQHAVQMDELQRLLIVACNRTMNQPNMHSVNLPAHAAVLA